MISRKPLPEFSLWKKKAERAPLFSAEWEITARCNNNCRHCYINLPADDPAAKRRELTLEEIVRLADDAASLGTLWCLVSGGEPLLRRDFPEIYVSLKKRGFLVSVFTNACLVTQDHIKLFKSSPPRDIEVSVYGVTRETYEKVTRKTGAFRLFERGLNLLLSSGIRVRLKAMALRSNLRDFPAIVKFCRQRTKDYFRFDPLLQLRLDRNEERNEEIKTERLSPGEIALLEKRDPERFRALTKECKTLIVPEFEHTNCDHIFHCGTGKAECVIGYDGMFRLCSALCHPACVYDLRVGSLADAYNKFVPLVRDMRSNRRDFLMKCRKCALLNLCFWCPGRAYLESGRLDSPIDYFCEIGHARAGNLARRT